jgi:hypothetical protein
LDGFEPLVVGASRVASFRAFGMHTVDFIDEFIPKAVMGQQGSDFKRSQAI